MPFHFNIKKLAWPSARRRHDGGQLIVHKTRDWLVALGLSALVAFLFLGFSASLFWGVWRGDVFSASTSASTSVSILNQKLLQDTVARYRARAVNFEEIKKVKPLLVDPSR